MTKSPGPQCVGFIMDGNRRWAKKQNLPTLQGHAAGYETLKKIIAAVHTARIPHMVCYAFSTENWKRTEEEVGYLMKLIERAYEEITKQVQADGKNVALRVIGEIDRLPESIQSLIAKTKEKSKEAELTVWIAFSYGGRAEIINAVNAAVKEGKEVDEKSFEKLLWTYGMPDPDFIIRTSGEKRLSNFLPWQSVYSEFFFTDTLWPDFGETEFQSILDEYEKRERRVGT